MSTDNPLPCQNNMASSGLKENVILTKIHFPADLKKP